MALLRLASPIFECGTRFSYAAGALWVMRSAARDDAVRRRDDGSRASFLTLLEAKPLGTKKITLL